jgi:hypothetical protein
MKHFFLVSIMGGGFAAAVAHGAAPKFASDIRPLFEKHCYACHAGEQAKSGFRLDVKSEAFRGGDGWGAAIVAGDADKSPLVQFARGDDPDLRMPPKESDLPPLTENDVALLVEWVNSGAAWPDGIDTASVVDRTDHWAFRPVRRPTAPPVQNTAWPINDIDRFILARLEADGLQPSAEAHRGAWLRRAAFDLIGLPPTPEDVECFAADTSPHAHERVLDRLLASPRYGERYAQHWLDVVRYADTHGYEVNTERPNAWPYRDYCIDALNADLPYDQFIREQIAGGEEGREAATGFLVTAAVLLPGQIGQDDASKRAARQDALNDIIGNVSDTVLGLTIGCARCHDHKFDPITAQDYYSLQAFFAGVQYGERPLQSPRANAVRRELAAVHRSLVEMEPLAFSGQPRATVNAHLNIERIVPTVARRVRFTIEATSSHDPCIDELEVYDTRGRNVALTSAGTKATATRSGVPSDAHAVEHVNDAHYGNSRSWVASGGTPAWVMLEFAEPVTIDHICWSRDRTGDYKDRLATVYRIEASVAEDRDTGWTLVADSTDRLPLGDESRSGPRTSGSEPSDGRPAALERAEKSHLQKRITTLLRDTRVFSGSFTQPHPVFTLHRGDPEQPKAEVRPESLGMFAGVVPPVTLPSTTPESDRRQAFAAWLTDSKQPLPARVMVNRIWQWHFGVGLVDTPNDFGRNGSKPSHPELLDWLADEFMASGWSVKHMHRLIMGSATFRQGSAVNSAGLAEDADSRLLWRFPPRRLEAETIRDTMLAVSGRLNLEMGGSGFDLFKSRGGLSGFAPIETFDPIGRRRMIYAHKVRMERDAVFGAFDCPDAGQSMARRRQSTTPIQALNLFNSPFTLDESQAFADRIVAEGVTAQGPDSTMPEGELVRCQIDRVFRLALSRAPAAVEARAAEAVVRDHGLATLCRVIFNSNEFVFVY